MDVYEFEKIYASSFCYDDDGLAIWPAQVVNFTNKTQFLFRISKGVLGINDDAVNDYFPPDQLRVPFRNMVYISDVRDFVVFDTETTGLYPYQDKIFDFKPYIITVMN